GTRKFVGAEFHITGLPAWTVMGGFVSRTKNHGKSRTIRQVNRTTKPVQLSDKSSISFEAKYDGPLSFTKVKSLKLAETDVVKIRIPNPESLDQILRRVGCLAKLYRLCDKAPVLCRRHSPRNVW